MRADDLHAHRQRRAGQVDAEQIGDRVPRAVQADRRDGRGQAETVEEAGVQRVERRHVLDAVQRRPRRVRRQQHDGAVAVAREEGAEASLELVHPPRQARLLLRLRRPSRHQE